MSRRVALAVALMAALSACGDSGTAATTTPSPKGERPSTAPSSSTSPSEEADPTPSVVASAQPPPGRSRCTLVLGMSVTANWFLDGAFESRPGILDARWELIWESGYDVGLFADPNGLPYTDAPLSPCADPPDRVLFQIAAFDWQDPVSVEAELRSSIDNIRATWPTLRTIELIPIVGGPGGRPCDDPRAPDKGILASYMNPPVVDAIAAVTTGDVVAGPDLLVADCSQFRDGTGHLTIDGSSYVASVLADHYGS